MELMMNFIENQRFAELYETGSTPPYLLICYDDDHAKVSETAYTDLDSAAAAGEAWKTSWRSV